MNQLEVEFGKLMLSGATRAMGPALGSGTKVVGLVTKEVLRASSPLLKEGTKLLAKGLLNLLFKRR